MICGSRGILLPEIVDRGWGENSWKSGGKFPKSGVGRGTTIRESRHCAKAASKYAYMLLLYTSMKWKSSSVSLVNYFTANDAVQPLWLSGNANGKINILSILSPVKSSYTFLNSAWHNTNLCLQSSFVHIFIRDTKKSWSDSMTKNEIRNWVPGMRDPDRKNCKVSHIFLPSDHSGYRVCQELNWPHLPYEVKITPFTKLSRILKSTIVCRKYLELV